LVSGFNHFTADMHTDPSHASLLYIFPARSRKVLGLGTFGVHLTPLKCRLHPVFAIWAHKPLVWWLHYHLLNSWILWVLNIPQCRIQVVVQLLVSEDEKALGTGINCLTKVHPLLHVTSYASKLSQLWFSITMIESTLQQTFVGHLNTGVCIISHFCIQIHSLQCYFLWENSFDAQKCLQLNSLLAGFLQRSSWQNCLPSC